MPSSDKNISLLRSFKTVQALDPAQKLVLGIDQYTEAIISVVFRELESNKLSRLYKAC